MSIYYKEGNLLNSPAQFICHQVNCAGKMNSGIAKQIREKWPIVYEQYSKNFQNISIPKNQMLGKIQYVPINTGSNKFIVNLFAQLNYGNDGYQYTSYDAFWNCLISLKKQIPPKSSIAFPKNIGCGLGGGNWNIIHCMIVELLAEEFEIYIYSYKEE